MNAPAVTLVVTNDFHSAVPTGHKLLAALREARGRGALVVDGGDFFGGNAFHLFSEGRVEERLLAGLYDAVVPGNHDLADLMRLADPGRFPPVVCANLTPPPVFAGRWEPCLLLPARERRPRVGIVGYLGRQAFEAVPPGERAGFAFTDPAADLIAAQRDRLLAAGADIVVGLSHSGFDHDVADQQRDWPLELVAAGHCHTGSYHWSSGGRHVVKAPENGAGLLRLDLDAGGPRTITCTPFPTEPGPPPGAEPELEGVLDGYEKWGAESLAVMDGPLPGRDAVAGALTARGPGLTGCEAIVLNLGCLRAGLPARITRRALADCAPFDNPLVRLNGPHTARELEEAARTVGETPVTTPRTAPGRVLRTVVVTRYLADRLALPFTPTGHTLHSVLIRLVEESP
ncbi:metallophosphoesterase [Streptomyces sp. NPDC057638]|uniref:metallophosphoesterase n=1 Tax=Streptomyces sp. NPDC057638 TaxID=3346190 RepID=UPI00369C220C